VSYLCVYPCFSINTTNRLSSKQKLVTRRLCGCMNVWVSCGAKSYIVTTSTAIPRSDWFSTLRRAPVRSDRQTHSTPKLNIKSPVRPFLREVMVLSYKLSTRKSSVALHAAFHCQTPVKLAFKPGHGRLSSVFSGWDREDLDYWIGTGWEGIEGFGPYAWEIFSLTLSKKISHTASGGYIATIVEFQNSSYSTHTTNKAAQKNNQVVSVVSE
jgi:hypothetical protein